MEIMHFSETDQIVVGVNNTSQSNGFTYFAYIRRGNSENRFQFNIGWGETSFTGILPNQKHTISGYLNSSVYNIEIDGISKSISPRTSSITGFPFFLFANNESGTAGSFTNIRCYKLTFWQNNNLIRGFIPCYRKSDNVIGMYDIVNNVFYINQGTGIFIKGPNV